MTVADNTSRNQYTATSGQTVFAYTFEIVDKSHIVVLKNGTTLSEGTDYTVSNVGNDNGGNVTLTSGATAGDILTLYRDMPYSRTQNYTNSGDFLASEVNADLDNLWLAGEQTNRTFSQSIRKPITDSDSISMELPESSVRANKYLKFSSTGGVTVAGGSTTFSSTALFPVDYGAVGDGTTDDTTAFNNMISAAQTINATGDVPIIDLDGKTYLIKGSLKFRCPITMLCNGATLKADGSAVSTDFDEILDGDGNGSGKYCFFDVEDMAPSSFIGNLTLQGSGTTALLGGVSYYPANLVAFARIRGNTSGESFNAYFDSLDIITFDRGFYTPDPGSGSGIFPFTRSCFGRLDFESVNMAFDFNSANAWDETFISVLRIARQHEPSNLFNTDLNAGNIFLNGNKKQHKVGSTDITLSTTSGSTTTTCNVADAFSVGDQIAIEGELALDGATAYGDFLITKVASVSGTTVTLEDQAGATVSNAPVYYAGGGIDIDQGKLIANKLYIEGPFYKCIHGSRLASISAFELKYSKGDLGAYKGHPIVIEHEYSSINIGRVSRKEDGISTTGKLILSYIYYGLVETSGRDPQHFGRISVIENRAQLASDGVDPIATGNPIYSASTPATASDSNLMVHYLDQDHRIPLFNASNLIKTFTPVVADASSGGNTATGTFEGSYYREGPSVYISIRLVDIVTTGMTSGNDIFIRGLPFTTANLSSGVYPFTGAVRANTVTMSGFLSAVINDNTDYIKIFDSSTGAVSDAVTVADLTSGASDLFISIQYLTDD